MKNAPGNISQRIFSLCNIVSITHSMHSKNRPLQASDFSSLYHVLRTFYAFHKISILASK